MAEHVIKLPDVGEGVAEAELVEWHVKVGDLVREDAVLAAVMTDKATVEIPAPVEGEIVWLGAEIGETIPVGSPIVRIRTGGEPGEVASEPEDSAVEPAPSAAAPRPSPQGGGEPGPSAEIASGPKDEIADSGARGDNDGRGRALRYAAPVGRQAAGLAGRPAEGARSRHRSQAGQRYGTRGPHHA
jgi:2-oxoisovalerate dehydrogenase E2 component (dihydrolipoyl transacylase)